MPRRLSVQGGPLVVVTTVLSVLLLTTAAIAWLGSRSTSVERPPGPPRAERAGSSSPAPDQRSGPTPSPRATAHPAAGPPQRVSIESLGLDAPVVPVTTEGRTLEPPADPQVLGWWSGGAPAGAPRGTALVTGHTVHDGGGALDDLERISAGSRIRVHTPSGRVDYVTESVDVLGKAALARRAERLFSQSVAGRLVLVTCEDWDGSGYRSNVVVTAVSSD